MRGSGSSQDEVRCVRGILDGIVLCQEASKTSTADDDLLVTCEMPPDPFDVVHDLLERIRLRPGALPMATEIE